MTTTTQVLMRFARATHVMTAEHHDEGHGMPYTLRIRGGEYTGTEIHCATEKSVTRLFNSLVDAYKSGTPHPFLVLV